MSALASITDNLVGLLPRLSRSAQIVDDAARLGQYPSRGLVDNVVGQARELQSIAFDLATTGRGDIGRRLGDEAISLARKGGVMHSMNQHHNTFAYSWRGSLQPAVEQVLDAVRQLS